MQRKDGCGVGLGGKPWRCQRKVVDVKRRGLIIVGCVSQTQLKMALEITELDVYMS